MSKHRLAPSQPNERLKQERLLRGWSQVYVANALDTDGYTVNRWERGRAQPSPYFRQKLCVLFEANAVALGLVPPSLDEANHVASSQPNDLPHTFPWSVPHPHNPCFTGREDILHTLHTQLTDLKLAARTQILAISGMAGCGKTQLATEYAYRYAAEYTAIFWIRAKTAEDLLSQLAPLAELLGLPVDQQQTDRQHLLAAVRHWLATHHDWLLIWDDLAHLELLQDLAPPTRQGALLMTTRCQSLGTLARRIPLEPMGPEEGILMLCKRATVLESGATNEQLHLLEKRRPDDYRAAARLVEIMGGLPLALDQAGAYLEETGCSLSNYVRLYQQQRMSLLNRRGTVLSDHPHSVATTFLLAHQHVEQEQASAADILRICTLLHAEAIPEELFREGAAHLGLGSVGEDSSHFDRAIAVLRNRSLLQRHPENHTLSIHCLVQVVLRDSLNEPERARWMRRLTATLNALFPAVATTNWDQCERLLPHILTIAAQSAGNTEDTHLGEVLQKVTAYLQERDEQQDTNVRRDGDRDQNQNREPIWSRRVGD